MNDLRTGATVAATQNWWGRERSARTARVAILGLALSIVPLTHAATVDNTAPPQTYVANGTRLMVTKARIQAGAPELAPAMTYLINKAESYLDDGPYSVTFDEFVAPNGDIHEFAFYGAYGWPNPDTPDGLPWIIIDGLTNPESELDLRTMLDMSVRARRLALAYYMTDDERYAEHAALLLRTWYLDEDTYMNPSMGYGAIVPGVYDDGMFAAPGTADFLVWSFDATALLEGSAHWTAEDRAGMATWAEAYLDWLLTDPRAAAEAAAINNHGTWADVHFALMASVVGDTDTATKILSTVGPNRIDVQIEPDGTMPAEIVRPDSLHYHEYVVRALQILADLGVHVGVDIWNYESPDGASIIDALELLAPVATGQAEWPYFPGPPFEPHYYILYEMYLAAAHGYWDPTYAQIADEVPVNESLVDATISWAIPADSPFDIDDDWLVEFSDLTVLLAEWGTCSGCSADFDGDGKTGFSDLSALLQRWGRIPG